MKRNPCPISGCDHNILPTSKYGVCGRHTEILAGFDWYLDKLAKAQTAKSKRKIILPDDPRYRQTISQSP